MSIFVVLLSLSNIWLFVTPWPVAHQAPQSSIISQSLLKFMFISQWYHPTISSSTAHCSYCHQSSPASGSFPLSQLFVSGGQSIRALASVFLMNIHCWFPLGLTGLMSLLSKGFSNTKIQKYQFFGTKPSFYGPMLTSMHDSWEYHSFDYSEPYALFIHSFLTLWRTWFLSVTSYCCCCCW